MCKNVQAPPKLPDEWLGVGEADAALRCVPDVREYEAARHSPALNEGKPVAVRGGFRLLVQPRVVPFVEGNPPAVNSPRVESSPLGEGMKRKRRSRRYAARQAKQFAHQSLPIARAGATIGPIILSQDGSWPSPEVQRALEPGGLDKCSTERDCDKLHRGTALDPHQNRAR